MPENSSCSSASTCSRESCEGCPSKAKGGRGIAKEPMNKASNVKKMIYQLPIPLCEMFMTEVFGENLPDTFDEETLTTINKFFENNLNVSETSRQLYVHRNTLVYRLEKLEKSTGLDIRKFDDALTFKIAMMVVSYMTYMNNSENL